MSSYWPFIIAGLVNGAVYALASMGLVLTYQTTGTFNLAFGAQAYVSAVVYYELRAHNDWGLLPALIVAILLVAPLLGLLLDRLVFRYLRSSSEMVRLGVSIGLLIAIPAVVSIVSGGTVTRFAPPSVGPEPIRFYRWGGINIDSDQLVVLIAAALMVVALLSFLRFTPLGLQMRAVVESPRMSELSGANSGRVNTAAWVISSTIAGLAGVLLAPLFPSLDSFLYILLVVAAIPGAVFGRLSSIPMAVAGSLMLGVGQALLVKWLPLGSVLAQGLRPSLPFLMLFALLMFMPGLRERSAKPDPMSGVDPPARIAGVERDRQLSLTKQLLLLGIGGAVATMVVSDYWLQVSSRALIFAVIFLSLTLLTGLSGHISLCHAAFVGTGAFVAGQLAVEQELSVIIGMFVGGLVAAAGGALLALPALRLGGLFLALATLAFGFMADNVVFVQGWAMGDVRGLDVPRPQLGSISFESEASFFVLAVIVLAGAICLFHIIRSGATGTLLLAMRGSEAAAQSVGVNPVPVKITVFCVSAFMAGVAGGLLGSLQGSVSTINFNTFQSLYWIVVILAVGVYTVRGAVVAGFLLVFVPEVVSHLPEEYALAQFVIFGLGVLTLARHPEGALDYLLEIVRRSWSRMKDASPWGQDGVVDTAAVKQ